MYSQEEMDEIKRVQQIEEALECPHCGGIQIKARNCGRGYTNYPCSHCGYVESSGSHLNRAIKVACNSAPKNKRRVKDEKRKSN